MVQCPNCFSWVNESVPLCPCCQAAVFPKPEPAVPAVRPPVPALGRSIVSLIFGIYAIEFAVALVFMSLFVAFTPTLSTDMPFPVRDERIFLLVYLIICSPIGIASSAVSIHNARIAHRAGNRTRIQQNGQRLGWLGLLLSLASVLISGAGLLVHLL